MRDLHFLLLLPCIWLLCLHALLLLSCNMNSSTSKSTSAAMAAATAVPAASFGNGTDRLSLLAFKAGIADDPTGALSSWNDTLHFCDGWRGVTCGRRHHQRVVALDLNSLNLRGYISPSVTNLTFLKRIDLGNNLLHGEIPAGEVGRLFRLRHLNLSINLLSGKIPANLSRCSNLRFIGLENNQLAGEIPVELCSLPRLINLKLTTNKLTGLIPPSLGNLSSLAVLYVGENNFAGGIPHDLGRITGLIAFEAHQNELSGTVPASFYNLSSLQYFAVASNRLYGTLPPDLAVTLPSLRAFVVYDNRFEGPIPTSLSNGSLLEELDFAINQFTGTIPDNLGNLQNLYHFSVEENRIEAGKGLESWRFLTSLTNCSLLRELSVVNNRLEGELPNSIANLSTGLEWLGIGGNRIRGTIPAGLGNLVNLVQLSMERNLFTGGIPSALGKLHRLGLWHLSSNRLTGEIPPSLGNLTRLYELDLSQNGLWGSIPPSFRNYPQLHVLDLSQNNLSGDIPTEIFGLSTVLYLDFSDNSLSGSLPVEVGSLSNLGRLHLSNNNLSGEITSAIGNCRSLEYLFLNGNLFRGTIPLSLRMLKGIQELDFSCNKLLGRISEFFGNFQYLRYLNLSFNNFEGEVPRNGVFTNASAISLVGNDKLCGGVSRLMQLPACPIHVVHKKRGRFHSLKVIIPLTFAGLCVFLLLCFISTIYLVRKLKMTPPISSSEDRHKKISYNELLKATEGFSSANLIGVGSFGSVYKGILYGDKTIVAVKVLNLQRQGASKSFMAECEALRNIRHRNLVKIITSCSSVDFGGHDFKALVFEFMPNGSLNEWLYPEIEVHQHQLRNLKFVERLSVAIDVASALDYLHNHCHTPIVHCDLKPNNILLDDDMNAHVGDFGLAKFLCEATSKNFENPTSSIGIKGSVGYVAPEYGLGGSVSTSGDAYSFGILLLEMFTAKKPINDMFKDGLNLRRYVETALPYQVMDIVDSRLISQKEEEEEAPCRTRNRSGSTRERMQGCLVSVMRIGLKCTKELPRERMEMGDVVTKIRKIRDIYLGITRSVAHQ